MTGAGISTSAGIPVRQPPHTPACYPSSNVPVFCNAGLPQQAGPLRARWPAFLQLVLLSERRRPLLRPSLQLASQLSPVLPLHGIAPHSLCLRSANTDTQVPQPPLAQGQAAARVHAKHRRPGRTRWAGACPPYIHQHYHCSKRQGQGNRKRKRKRAPRAPPRPRLAGPLHRLHVFVRLDGAHHRRLRQRKQRRMPRVRRAQRRARPPRSARKCRRRLAQARHHAVRRARDGRARDWRDGRRRHAEQAGLPHRLWDEPQGGSSTFGRIGAK